MSFKAYIDYLKNGIGSNSDIDKPCLYLKDWHIVRFHRSANDTKLPYECPVYFQSDWLNEFSEDKDMDDYKFCYMGPNGSFLRRFMQTFTGRTVGLPMSLVSRNGSYILQEKSSDFMILGLRN